MTRLRAAWVCLLVSASANADRYVSTNGTHDGSFLTWDTAATNIQAAVDAAASNETIHVTNGTYYSTGPASNSAGISITKAVRLASVNGPDVTIIDGNYPVVTNKCIYVNAAARITGLTIRNGYVPATAAGIVAQRGAGLYLDAGAGGCVLSGCTIISNVNALSFGGGLTMNAGTLDGCRVLANSAVSGAGGVFLIDGLITNGCVIAFNSAQKGGGVQMNAGRIVGGAICSNQATQATGNGYGGGGVSCASGAVLIEGCNISGNAAANWGGGVLVYQNNTTLTMRDCTVSNNTATRGGGVMWYNNGGRIDGCRIVSNRAGSISGGLDLYGTTTVTNCTFELNAAPVAGGMYFVGPYGARVVDCLFTNNTATDVPGGGGLYFHDSLGLLERCRLVGNRTPSASGQGGGVLLRNGKVRGCLIAGNSSGYRGGGVGFYNEDNDTVLLENCTIASNTAAGAGGGVYAYNFGDGCLTNTIVYVNVAPAGTNWGGSPVAAYCCTVPTNGLTGTRNVEGDPSFSDVAAGDYRLKSGSPCIGAGTNQSWMTNSVDLGGVARIAGDRVDIGAYEFVPRPGTGTRILMR